MSLNINLCNMPCFGVAGNFTGHLEQAGEAVDFKNVVTKEANAPKALFPTYIPCKESGVSTPDFLRTFPFSADKIIFPKGEQKVQIESECGIVFSVEWNKADGKVVSLKPVCFGASNDCSIRKEGAKKISLKKNWGECSKGFSSNMIPLSSFDSSSIIDNYRIASFMIRGNDVFEYGEDSAVNTYSYVYEKLTDWIIEKLNFQKDEGPAENINSYLKECNFPENIFVSIGATRYTEFGESNFLSNGDRSVVILYPEGSISKENMISVLKEGGKFSEEISVLNQEIVL